MVRSAEQTGTFTEKIIDYSVKDTFRSQNVYKRKQKGLAILFYVCYTVPCEKCGESRKFKIVRCSKMKQNLHPEYNEAVVKCACGATFTTRSTKSELRVDICSKCHPFFTGKQKLVDAGGRVDRFNKKFNLGK